MSQKGHERRSHHVCGMSAYPSTADVRDVVGHVTFELEAWAARQRPNRNPHARVLTCTANLLLRLKSTSTVRVMVS